MAPLLDRCGGARVTRQFRYRACGLSIHADAPIPGARAVESFGTPDVLVRMRGRDDSPPVDGEGAYWYRSPDEEADGVPLMTVEATGPDFLFRYSEGARFLVSGAGSGIDAWWDAPLTEADAADYLLGGILAFVVRLRGMVPLHASAIVVNDHAVLFAGAAGSGKSSTAAACAALGAPVLSDDVVALEMAGGCVVAHPSHPRVSIWSDSATALFAARTLPAHSPVYEKRRLDLIDTGLRFHECAAPVDRIFILGDREADRSCPSTAILSSTAALMELVTHSFGNYLLDAPMRAREFDLLARLALSVRVDRLSFGEGFEALVSSCRELVGIGS